jgi:nucleoside-specific outer membrane channel protein Tsx
MYLTGASIWSDAFLGYRSGTQFHDPAIEPAITKNIVSFTFANRYSLGSNLVNVDVFMSDRNDPANGSGSRGAQEIYLLYRSQLNFNKAFKAPVKFGVVRDISLTAGFDLNTKDTAFAPRKRVIVVGPTVNFEIPQGFLDISVLYYKEWNHDSFGIVKDVEFDGTYMINASWGIPIILGTVTSVVKGFGNYVGPKGLDGALVETAAETLVRASWMFNVGAAIGSLKATIFLGLGFEYWRNKFGNPTPILDGAMTKPNHTTFCPTIQFEIHL